MANNSRDFDLSGFRPVAQSVPPPPEPEKNFVDMEAATIELYQCTDGHIVVINSIICPPKCYCGSKVAFVTSGGVQYPVTL